MKHKIKTAYDAYTFLVNHPKAAVDKKKRENPILHAEAFFEDCWITYVKVNPATNAIDDDSSQNTAVRVWIEGGPREYVREDWEKGWISTHDPRLDVGGPTFDDALIAYAKKVKKHYGDYDE